MHSQRQLQIMRSKKSNNKVASAIIQKKTRHHVSGSFLLLTKINSFVINKTYKNRNFLKGGFLMLAKKKRANAVEEFVRKTFIAKAKEYNLDQNDALQSFENPRHICVEKNLLGLAISETFEAIEEEYEKFQVVMEPVFDYTPLLKNVVVEVQNKIRSAC